MITDKEQMTLNSIRSWLQMYGQREFNFNTQHFQDRTLGIKIAALKRKGLIDYDTSIGNDNQGYNVKWYKVTLCLLDED